VLVYLANSFSDPQPWAAAAPLLSPHNATGGLAPPPPPPYGCVLIS